MALVVRAQVYPRARYHVMVRQMPLDLDSANSAQLSSSLTCFSNSDLSSEKEGRFGRRATLCLMGTGRGRRGPTLWIRLCFLRLRCGPPA